MCNEDCKNCKEESLPVERLEPNKKHVIGVGVDTELISVGAEAHIAIGNLILVIIVENENAISLEIITGD
ncbi:MAG: hypothetical protein KQ78_01789 [Candidatus Izimaplasma bacterium HR2]|nr:MAG: hypothetical protein KQ78_01789 [Candidatus Izimaplasma bacterium HR2]